MSGDNGKNQMSIGGYIDSNIACNFKIKSLESNLKIYESLELAAKLFCNEINRRNRKEPEYVISFEFSTVGDETQ